MYLISLKILVLFTFLSIFIGITSEKPGCKGNEAANYEAPGTVTFPLGDEGIEEEKEEEDNLSSPCDKPVRISEEKKEEKDTLSSPCGERAQIKDSEQEKTEKKADCGGNIGGLEDYKEPYLPCVSVQEVQEDSVLYTSDAPGQNPQLICKRCDLQVTADSARVLVHCFECCDQPSCDNDKNNTPREVIIAALFLEIANYTSDVKDC